MHASSRVNSTEFIMQKQTICGTEGFTSAGEVTFKTIMYRSKDRDYNVQENKNRKEEAMTALVNHPCLPTSYEVASFFSP